MSCDSVRRNGLSVLSDPNTMIFIGISVDACNIDVFQLVGPFSDVESGPPEGIFFERVYAMRSVTHDEVSWKEREL